MVGLAVRYKKIGSVIHFACDIPHSALSELGFCSGRTMEISLISELAGDEGVAVASARVPDDEELQARRTHQKMFGSK